MDATAMKFLGVAITMLGGTLGAGYGLSHVFATWLTSIARNPAADDKMKTVGFIGFAGTELVILLSFVVAMTLIFAA